MNKNIYYGLFAFIVVTLLIATLIWFYLNIQASMQVSARNSSIRLSDELPTKIAVGNYLQTHARGKLDTSIDVNQKLQLPLQGKYRANLQFIVEVPVAVDVDYQTNISVDQMMPLKADTSLIYKTKWLPKFPLKLDVPVKLSVPFHLKRQYHIPIKILFNGPVYMEFDEHVLIAVNHLFKPSIVMDDAMTTRKIADFNATLKNIERNTQANLEMEMDLKLSQIHK
ncbi:hypothetical protein A3K93_04245 [Acinetobacter sp. NCu2D-2]|uniref:hypothetical protein n=1 Tax=Acinetobacter sp. NCu2D-2 TaxID=1608473 RepID=UPI0007CDF6AF|nr:hypothetical protein [Acinetobacter sp. NCu2D-2]ANF81475.1 hypothetical protein A3K93_04245 [Acinetobacter sp. NCu2D-2]